MDTVKEPQKSQEFIKTKKIFKDYTIMLLAICFASCFIYGLKVLLLATVSVLSCFIFRWLGEKILGNKSSPRDYVSFATGLTITMLLPITSPWWVALCGGIFASVVCIIPFGTPLKSPFSPACASICFLILCFPEEMFKYSETGILSLTKMLTHGNSVINNSVAIIKALAGDYPSAIGVGSVFLLIGVLIFLTIRNPKGTIPTYTFILSVAIFALCFPRVSTGRMMSVFMELCSGMLLFSAIFFMTYPSVMPERLIARAVWGFSSGIICMLTRYFGAFEETILFGVIISQALAGLFDALPLTKKEKKAIVMSPQYVGEPETSVVPEEILQEIPDVPEEEIINQEIESAKQEESDENQENEETVPVESESLDEVISEENTIDEKDTPFMTGGDGDER